VRAKFAAWGLAPKLPLSSPLTTDEYRAAHKLI